MSEDSSDLAVEALQGGAVALVHKPTALATDRLFELSDELRAAVATAALASPRRGHLEASSPIRATPPPRVATSLRRVVAIGASTGGPQALTALLTAFPKDYPVPIVIVLHMPIGYTEALSRRLDGACAIEVVEAHEGVLLLPGRAIIARAGMHLKVRGGERAVGTHDLSRSGSRIDRRSTCSSRASRSPSARPASAWCSPAWATTGSSARGRSGRSTAWCSPRRSRRAWSTACLAA